ncbi:MAG TPA: hypothetical protein VFV33_04500 [Gemmatimonadaceae bacterium]|nr:hypothetical protein [Gemmatimonadaceae bacterium]
MRGSLVCLLVLTLMPRVSGQDELVLVRPSDPLFHWPGCPRVTDTRDVLAMTKAQAAGRGKKPHDECDPANPPQTPDDRKRAAALATPVFVDTTSRYYHREKCRLLGNGARRLSLDEAARKHFPCRTCKPPVRPRPKR